MENVLNNTAAVALECGNAKVVLRRLPDSSIDSIVCDPPYEIGFQNKGWDSTGVAYDTALWAECLRVLKPGGYLLAFSSARTYHRMAVAIEDAGFDIRDQLMWIYASGMPKSRNVAKYDMSGPAAAQWAGWGTGIKPSHEPVCMARKPFRGTVAANMLMHGTGALNIDACRAPFAGEADEKESTGKNQHADAGAGVRGGSIFGDMGQQQRGNYSPPGRWPSNVLHDGSAEVVAMFPESSVTGKRSARSKAAVVDGTSWLTADHQSTEYTDAGSAARFFYCAKAAPSDRHDGLVNPGPQFKHGATMSEIENTAAGGKTHCTVKPTTLMRWLCRLVTPPGGIVLDPFMGSGSTGRGARLEGFRFIGIDITPDYYVIAGKRIAAVDLTFVPVPMPTPVATSAHAPSAQLSLLEAA